MLLLGSSLSTNTSSTHTHPQPRHLHTPHIPDSCCATAFSCGCVSRQHLSASASLALACQALIIIIPHSTTHVLQARHTTRLPACCTCETPETSNSVQLWW